MTPRAVTTRGSSSDDGRPPPLISASDMLDLLEHLHSQLAGVIGDFTEAQNSVLTAAYNFLGDLIDDKAVKALRNSAVRLRKLTDIISGQTVELSKLQSDLKAIEQFAANLQELINAITPVLARL